MAAPESVQESAAEVQRDTRSAAPVGIAGYLASSCTGQEDFRGATQARAELGSAPLENYANNSSPLHAQSTLKRSSLREGRYARRGLLWDVSGLERVRKCGRASVLPAGGVAVRAKAGVAGFAGLATCGSVWADPVCNAKVMARRAVEIGAAVALWQAQGGAVGFATFTMRHTRGQTLPALWDALSAAWGKVTCGSQWLKDKQRHGVVGWLRVVEVTYGVNGWHVHVHCVLFLTGKQTDGTVRALHARMVGRWSRRLVGLGLMAPWAIGQEAHLVKDAGDGHLSRYLTKATDAARRIGLEVTQTQSKTAQGLHKTRSPWALLDDVQDLGDATSLGRWHEWERGSKGRKQMTWSKGTREQLGLLVEKSDEDVAAEEHGSSADDLVLIDGRGWKRLTQVPADLARLLDVTERLGLTGLRAFLDVRAITYSVMD